MFADDDEENKHNEWIYVFVCFVFLCKRGHHYNCKIHNDYWKARKQQTDAFDTHLHEWVGQITICHCAMYH